nr:retrovirus-related Pol polyprotein from transposon TNT 1-94 [Tanacetum cinerariifolium]
MDKGQSIGTPMATKPQIYADLSRNPVDQTDYRSKIRVYYVEGLKHNLFSVGQFCDADLEVAFRKSTCFVRDLQGNDLLIVESIHIRFDEIKEVSETSVANDTSGLVPQRQKASDYDNPDPSTSTPSTHSNVHAEENNHDQAKEGEQLQDDEFTNPFCAPTQKEAESSSHNIGGKADSTWIEAMQEELHQFDRLQVYRLRKALYGLKQAPRAWYDELSAFLTLKGFTKGLQIHQSPSGIFINQAKYTLEILHKHGMDKGQSIGTPMATKPKLDADLSGNPVDQTDYRSKIRSLMYLTSSRPDIVQAICFCVRYQSRLTEKHLKEVKRIFRYLRGTVKMGLWYPKDSSFELTAFSDVDHAGCIDSCKSTSGGIQFLGDKLVSWMSKKQNCTAMSSAEAEYVALSTSCGQVMWMRIQLQDYGFNYNKIPLYCDSQTEYQLADMFTKSLPKDRFKYLVRRIGMRCLTPAELEVLVKESA